MRGVRMAERLNALTTKNWPLSLEAVLSTTSQAAVMVRGDALMDVAELLAQRGWPGASRFVLDLIAREAASENLGKKAGE